MGTEVHTNRSINIPCKKMAYRMIFDTPFSILSCHPQYKDIQKIENSLKILFMLYTEFKENSEIPKPNHFISINELTSKNCCKMLKHSSEQKVAKYFADIGMIQYNVIAKEDIQWCDWFIWSNNQRLWIPIELKSNCEDPLFNERGEFVRLGTITTKKKLLHYFSKGLRLNKISKILGIGEIKLLYIGKICPNAKTCVYLLDFDKDGIKKYTKLIDNIC